MAPRTQPPAANTPPAEAPSTDSAPAAPAKRGAIPILRAHAAWVDHVGLGIRVEAGEALDWADERVQRLFRSCLNWQAFGVEFQDIPLSKAEATAALGDAAARIAELEGQVKTLTGKIEHVEDEATKAVAKEMADLTEQVAKVQAALDERTKQLEETTGKLQAAIAGEKPAA